MSPLIKQDTNLERIPTVILTTFEAEADTVKGYQLMVRVPRAAVAPAHSIRAAVSAGSVALVGQPYRKVCRHLPP
jgi:hypothetical protein